MDSKRRMFYLYIWDGLEGDDAVKKILGAFVSPGLLCIAARNEEQAWELLKRADPVTWWNLQGQPTTPMSKKYPGDGKLLEWILTDIAPFIRGGLPGAANPYVATESGVFYRRAVH